MIAKPHPAALAAALSDRFATLTKVRAARHLPAQARHALLAAGMAALLMPMYGHAQAAPGASQVSAQATAAPATQAPPRDFAAERKAIGDSRAWTNYRYGMAEHDCYNKFFVTHCIDKAKDVQREELQVLRKRELEIGDAERAFKAAERDKAQAIKRAEYESGQPGREANERANRESFERKQQDQQLRDAQHQADAPQRAANAEAYNKKQADFDARVKAAQAQGAQQAVQRQENVKAFEAKQRDAAQRQKDLDERRAKAKEQQEKQGQGAAPRPFGF
ncbi:hypothetical protein P3W85_05605 [Cupriavidus basilensis]|uniref:Membrane protein involved in colicin uptake n=1 Tax=Cupriavidus basilensis TaxID=68895 RepID=A0ABT6AII7_9BURK|nr:hypothetical protein [Cupriavidus basilensis]MDF3832420.1 hypothetical protein [Cupriavidus basilensis]